MATIIVLLVILLLVGLALRSLKKKGHCSSCSSCHGCDAAKHFEDEINKKWNSKLAEEFISLIKSDFE